MGFADIRLRFDVKTDATPAQLEQVLKLTEALLRRVSDLTQCATRIDHSEENRRAVNMTQA